VIFQDFPGPGIFKKKIQDFPGGVGTVYASKSVESVAHLARRPIEFLGDCFLFAGIECVEHFTQVTVNHVLSHTHRERPSNTKWSIHLFRLLVAWNGIDLLAIFKT